MLVQFGNKSELRNQFGGQRNFLIQIHYISKSIGQICSLLTYQYYVATELFKLLVYLDSLQNY